MSNFATFNPSSTSGSITLSAANLGFSVTTGASSGSAVFDMVVNSGAWFYEYQPTALGAGGASHCVGISAVKGGFAVIFDAPDTAYSVNNVNTTTTSYPGFTINTNTVMGVLLDVDNHIVSLYINGVFAVAVPFNDQLYSGGYQIYAGNRGTGQGGGLFNTGQINGFLYGPSGTSLSYQAWSFQNVAEFTNDLEVPDLVWIKNRASAASHTIFDNVRTSTPFALYSKPGTYTYSVPNGVTQVQVTARGAGGAGGSGHYDANDVYAGAGGGSGYITTSSFTVTPGQNFTITVGAGGKAAAANSGTVGGAGQASSFVGNGKNVTGNGGLGGNGATGYGSPAGGVGQFNGSKGYSASAVQYQGGDGAGTGQAGQFDVAGGFGLTGLQGGVAFHGGSFDYGAGGGGAGDLGAGQNALGYIGGAGGPGGGAGGGSVGGSVAGDGGDGYIKIFDGNTSTNANYFLNSDTTTGDQTDVNSLIQFNKNGFYLGNSSVTNTNNSNYVAWMWKAGGAPTVNNDGTITSRASVNKTFGISLVTYIGSGITTDTVGHGLGVAPNIVIVKNRNAATYWPVKSSIIGPGANVVLNTTAAQTSTFVNGGIADLNSSKTFGFINGSTNLAAVNAGNQSYIAYCFNEIVGYSKFNAYIGNGSTDGPFVYCGFRPAFLMVKNLSSGTADWVMYDSARNPYNIYTAGTTGYLNEVFADKNSVEDSNGQNFDFLANGFKARSTAGNNTNVSTNWYLFMAFAECPFNYSNAR